MLKRIGAEELGEFKAVASGTLPSGRPVAVNADGTVSVIGTTVVTETVGSAVVFESAGVTFIASTYDSSNNKIVVAYRDNGNSQNGTAVVGTISGTSITFGTPVVFQASRSDDIAITFDSSSNKVVIAYRDHANSYYGTAIIGTVSGTSISFGTKVTFNSGATNDISLVHDSTNNKTVIAYKNDSNNYGYAIVGTVSGTSISFGSAAAFASHTIYETKISYDSANGKVVIAYTNASQQGTAIVGTVSSTSISFGSATAFDTGEIAFIDIAYDVASGKSVIVFMKGPGGNAGAQAIVGTVSSTSISFGTAVVYDSGSGNEWNTVVYHADAEKVIVVYWDNSNSDRATAITGTVSGTSISFANSAVLEDGAISYISPAYDSTNKVVFVALDDGGNSYYGTGVVYQPTYSSQNLTSENYIGMSRGVAFQTGSASSTGSETVFESAATDVTLGAYDTTNDKVLIAYKDQGNSNYGTAIVGTISGTSISFGTAAVFESATVSQMSMSFDSTAGKFLIAYKDEGNSNYGTAIVATISGTSVSFGSPTVFANNGNTNYNSTVYDPVNNKTIIAYSDGGNSSHGTAIVGTISGTSVSFGSAVVFEAANSTWMSAVHDSSAGKIVIIYSDEGNSNRPTGIVGTVSGTSISFGSAATVSTDNSSQTRAVFDSTNNKVVLCYKNDSGTPQGVGTAAVGTVSGTSISFGSTVDYSGSDVVIAEGRNAISFDSSSSGVLIVYEGGDDRDAKAVRGVVSGTSITFGTVAVLDTGGAHPHIGNIYDPDQNTNVVFYKDGGNSNYGTALVFQPDTRATTRAEVANSGNASVDIIGSVSNNQIGLTAGQQYFVQTDGTIGTTAATPSVLAGTAISATELLVKT